MKKLFRRLKVVFIDVYIYKMDKYKALNINGTNYKIEKSIINKQKTRYYIKDGANLVHESYLFSNVFLLRLIKKRGPVIGDCKTIKAYRGQSIYPYVINNIAKDILAHSDNEVFIIVDKNNLSSIKGIEKSHYTRIASIEAKRWLWFYLKKNVSIIKNNFIL